MGAHGILLVTFFIIFLILALAAISHVIVTKNTQSLVMYMGITYVVITIFLFVDAAQVYFMYTRNGQFYTPY
jgi:hypothetical protein